MEKYFSELELSVADAKQQQIILHIRIFIIIYSGSIGFGWLDS